MASAKPRGPPNDSITVPIWLKRRLPAADYEPTRTCPMGVTVIVPPSRDITQAP